MRSAAALTLFALLLSSCAHLTERQRVPGESPAPGVEKIAPSEKKIPAGEEIVLARRGRTEYQIVVSDSASRAVVYAAFELQSFLQQMTDAELPVVSDRLPRGKREILVGESSRTRALIPGLKLRSLGEEGRILRTVGQDLVIVGPPRGTLYGVYDLIERFGCRWFTPEVSRIPHIDRLALGPLDETITPVFEYRDTYLWEACNGDWAARNRFNRNGRRDTLGDLRGGRIEWVPGMFAHTFEKLVPPDKYFSTHPEYYSLVGGKRLRDRSQLCCTNEEVARIAAESVIRAFRENPQATIVSVSQNDWYNSCECPSCKELAEREGTPMAPVLLLVNRVAEAVEKECPGKLVDTLAYQWSRPAPKTMRPRANVVIRLCTIECCFSHSLQFCDSPQNRAFVRDLDAWSRVSNRIWIWNYCTSFAQFFIPFPDLRSRGDTMRLFAARGVKGVFVQDVYTTPNGELSGLSGYLNARLLSDPYADTGTVIGEFLDGVYGRAARPIGAYLDMLHEAVVRDTVHVGVWQGPDAGYLTDWILARADSLWNEAENSVRDLPDVLERVRVARLSSDYAIICRDRLRGGAFLVDQERLRLDPNPAFLERVDRFCGVAERAGVTRLREYDLTVPEFRKEIETTIHPRTLTLHDSVACPGSQPGLAYRYYEGAWRKLPDFAALKPGLTGVTDRLALPCPAGGTVYAFVLDGFIEVPRDGVYTFRARSDGYSALTVAGEELFRNGGSDPIREKCGYVALKAGPQPIQLVYFTREGCSLLDVTWSGPGFEKEAIPSSAFRTTEKVKAAP
jgi:hypothetical protein